MSKLKETIDKALEKTYWVDSVGDFKNPSDYPQEFEQKFGNISLNTIVLDDYLIDAGRIDDIHVFFKKWNFNATQQYKINDLKSGYYYNDYLYLMIRCNYGFPENKIKKDDDDDDFALNTGETLAVFSISFCPLIKNKSHIQNFLKELIELNILFIPDSEKNFYMIAQNQQGLYKRKTTFNNIEIKDGRYDIYYGSKFPFEKFKRFMKDENTESLLLLHGDPGAGKSNLLKNLILEAEEDVIYVPPSMVSVISSPGFISFMIENKKNFLIIEDAEEILSTERNSGTNNLLGICDGFLKDALKMKIICTFNCDLKKIDPALLRKGRLYFEYKFGALPKEEGQKLVDFCNLGFKVNKEMTLAEIFNHDKEISVENSFEERTIGFGNF
jgi:hypothetical protein